MRNGSRKHSKAAGVGQTFGWLAAAFGLAVMITFVLAEYADYRMRHPGMLADEPAIVPTDPLDRVAPDFSLSTSDGSRSVMLSGFRGKKPVALLFGSFS